MKNKKLPMLLMMVGLCGTVSSVMLQDRLHPLLTEYSATQGITSYHIVFYLFILGLGFYLYSKNPE